MKKASSLCVLLFFAALATQVGAQHNPRPPGTGGAQGGAQGSFDPNYGVPGGTQGGSMGHPGHHHGHQGHHGQHMPPTGTAMAQQIISERVNQVLRFRETRRLSELLRLSLSESRGLEVTALTISGSSLRGHSQVEILSRGHSVAIPQIIRRQLSEVTFILPSLSRMDDLEIIASDDLQLDIVTAHVKSSYSPYPGGHGQVMQPSPGEMLRLNLREEIRGMGEIRLKQLVRQQLGLSLEGAQIERIAIESMSTRGVGGSVQLELNNRLVGPAKPLSSQGITPLVVNSFDEVVSSLDLIVRGDVIITHIGIRVGQVRPIQQLPSRMERVFVSQEISSGRPLELARLLPYETRLVSEIMIEARSLRSSQAEVALIALGQIVDSTFVSQVPMRPVLRLLYPRSVRDLKLQSLSQVLIDTIEIGFTR